ncbi:ribosome silencing factor [Peptoanaerobacter stomatis]|jgi:iojap-like protein|uniref:Ribosomal silencing factor RsfS n=1 Tax=Peptoanaerobacter stomatis TaxID=796937 RepID=G9X0C9_9FIRM|nr:ribosome silencing factor [Peptoanaerobacter stomatis]EHL15476.1 iojap protein 155 [Peptoanaerobacter stomatis]EHL19362.1 iojap protein 155 [Peptoanaerobacter stomatis]
MTTNEKIKKIYEVLDKKLGEDIVVLNVNGISSITDYFVIVSAPSERQVKALEDALDYEMSKLGVEPRAVEGKNSAKWILIDYNDIVVHIFKTEDREFYNLERLWKDAVFVDIDEVQ